MVSLREEDSSGASLVGDCNAFVCVRYLPYFTKKNKIENDEEVEYGMLVASKLEVVCLVRNESDLFYYSNNSHKRKKLHC